LKKRTIIALCLVVVLAVSLFLIAYNRYRTTQIDTSWVEEINSKLENYSYLNEPELEQEFNGLAMDRIYLFENSTIYYIITSGDNDTLRNYLYDLLNKATIQQGTLSSSELKELFPSSRAVEIILRFFTTINHHEYSDIYFILDNHQGLTGKILAQERGSTSFNILEVSKLQSIP
jgi:hypothetical protein